MALAPETDPGEGAPAATELAPPDPADAPETKDVAAADAGGEKADETAAAEQKGKAEEKGKGRKDQGNLDDLIKAGEGGDGGAPADPKDLAKQLADVPEQMRGKTLKETLDNVMGAYKGLRDQGVKVPKSAGDYQLNIEGPAAKLADPEKPEDKAVLDHFRAVSHKHGLSDAQFNGVLQDFVGGLEGKGLIDAPFDATAEFEVLGGKEEGLKIATALNAYGEGLFRQEILDATELEEFKIMAGTGYGARVMVKLRALTGQKPFATHLPGGDGKLTDAELQSRLADEKYQTDPAFQAETTRLYREKYGTEPQKL